MNSNKKNQESWPTYLNWFHARRAGITEKILSVTRSDGQNPYEWLMGDISQNAMALDLACGSAPLGASFPGFSWVGIDRSSGELGEAASKSMPKLTQGDVGELPFCDNAFELVVCSMALMLFDSVDAVLVEIRRVLRQGGTLLLLLPGSYPLSWRDRLRYFRVLLALGELRPSYPNQIHLGPLARRLKNTGFEVVRDNRKCFKYPLANMDFVRSFIESLYARFADQRRLEKAMGIAHKWEGSEIGIPLRRLECIKVADHYASFHVNHSPHHIFMVSRIGFQN